MACYFGDKPLSFRQILWYLRKTLCNFRQISCQVGNKQCYFGKMPCPLGQIRCKKGNLPCHFGDNLLHSGQTLPINSPTASTFAFAPNHTNQPQGQSQKSLPTDTSEKEIFKNAPPHNKNKIHHSGQLTLTTEDENHYP